MTDPTARWALHPARALPADPVTRPVARQILDATQHLPIVSMHGHVDAGLLARDEPFGDPASLLVVPDHYLVRMLVSQGVPHDALGVPRRDGCPVETDPREIWRTFAAHWHLFRGTPTRFWLEHVLVDILGVEERLSAATADAAYDTIAARLAEPGFRPLALLDRYDIEIIATTDPAWASLTDHADLAARGWGERVVPTFRPDAVLHPDRPGWAQDVERLGAAAGTSTSTYRGWVAAMADRRAWFRAHGAVSADHSHEDVGTAPLDDAEAERLYARALAGTVTPAGAVALRRHMLLEMAHLSTQDGLTMTLHPGVRRNHHGPTAARFGPDTGHDIPLPGAFTDHLRPLLERFGTHPDLRVVLFTLDESVTSRELAPLAGFYPSVYVGAPWWFLDAPASIRRWRESVTEIAGLSRTSGFIDDTRALLSIPARHDMARRLDAGFLAGLVAEHRLDEDEAADALVDLVVGRPAEVFRL